MDTRVYWLWLQSVFLPGSAAVYPLLHRAGTPQALYELSAAEVETLTETPLSPDERVRLEAPRCLHEAQALLTALRRIDAWTLVPDDELYPALLREEECPPLVLYGQGTIPPWERCPCVTVVGSRHVTDYGRRLTMRVAGGLALGGAIVVSGGAVGIDALAHEAALAVGCPTVAVQACGLDVEYPAVNAKLRSRIRQTGAVLTEYPLGVTTRPEHFRVRNRILSGLAEATCVVEAKQVRSGALMTAHLAMSQGRAVYAAAGDALTGRSKGTDTLLREDARLLTDAADVLAPLAARYPSLDVAAGSAARDDPRLNAALPTTAPRQEAPVPPARLCPPDVSVTARAAFDALEDGLSLPEELQVALGLDPAAVLAALTELELRGCAVSDALGRYSLC